MAASNVGTLGLVVVILVRIYSGWGYVASRLQSKVIEYEETGWYDGNFEPKTEAELKRDQFLYKSDVKPAVDRVKLATLTAAGLWVMSCIGLNTAVSMKPLFNEYDPSVLERVRNDDDFANEAAKASAGKPTYCDNRYYRAVANGGQGKRRGLILHVNLPVLTTNCIDSHRMRLTQQLLSRERLLLLLKATNPFSHIMYS